MNSNLARNYRCKNEELPVICEHVSFSLKRDSVIFSGYASRFNESYVADFDGKIVAVNKLVNPTLGTADLKITTTRLYATMDGLQDPAKRLVGYLKLAKNRVLISPADFGLTELRNKLRAKDAEGVLHNLPLVIANIGKFKEPLTAEGLTDDIETQLANAIVSIAQDNERQYEILSGRKALVQDNKEVFNSLGAQLAEICEVGKILFKATNPERAQEYTFAYLLKKVRVGSRKKGAEKITGVEEEK
jgi:hypothetical protein